jgi:chromosome segregation ATPase
VEILGAIKFGERADELRERVKKLQAESDSKISQEVHQGVLAELKKVQAESDSKFAPEEHQRTLARLKDAEAKASQPSPDSNRLRGQLKERDDRIAQLEKQLNESNRSVEILTKELVDSKGKVEIVTTELRGSQKNLTEASRQIKDQSKKIDEYASTDRHKTLLGYIHQFENLEKRSSWMGNAYVEQNYTKQYNEILRALKKELPNDNYIQSATPLSEYGTSETFSTNLKSASSRLRGYLQQRYLEKPSS